MAQIIKMGNPGAEFINAFAAQTSADTEAKMRMSAEAAKNQRYEDENARLNEKAAMESASFRADIRVRSERSKGRPVRDVSWASTQAQGGNKAITRIGNEIEALGLKGGDTSHLVMARSRMEAEQDQRLKMEGEYLDHLRAQQVLSESLSKLGRQPTQEELDFLQEVDDPRLAGYIQDRPPISAGGSRGGGRGGSGGSGGGGQGYGGPNSTITTRTRVDGDNETKVVREEIDPPADLATRTHGIWSAVVGINSQVGSKMEREVVDNHIRDILDKGLESPPPEGSSDEAIELYQQAMLQTQSARRLLDVKNPDYSIDAARKAAAEAETSMMVAITPSLAARKIDAAKVQYDMDQKYQNSVDDMNFFGQWQDIERLNARGLNEETGLPWRSDGVSSVTNYSNILSGQLDVPALSRGGPNSSYAKSKVALARQELYAAMDRFRQENPGLSERDVMIGVHNKHVNSMKSGKSFASKAKAGNQWLEYVNWILGDQDIRGGKWYSNPHTAAISRLNEFKNGFWEEDKGDLPPAAQAMADNLRAARAINPDANMGDISSIFTTDSSYQWQGRWDAWFDIAPGWESHSTNAVFEGVVGASAASGIDIAVFSDLSIADIATRAGRTADSEGHSPAEWSALGQSLVNWMEAGPEDGLDIYGQANRLFSMIPYGKHIAESAARGWKPTNWPGIGAEYHKKLSGITDNLDTDKEILPGPAVREKSKARDPLNRFGWMGNGDKRNKVEAARFEYLMADTDAISVMSEMADEIRLGGSPDQIDPIVAAMPSAEHITQYMTWRDAGVSFLNMPEFLRNRLGVISEQIITMESKESTKKFNKDSDQHQMDRQEERKPMEARFEKMKRDRHRREENQREQRQNENIRKAKEARDDVDSRAGDWDEMTPEEIAEVKEFQRKAKAARGSNYEQPR